MTMQTDSAAGNFRLSMLISDTRYRSYTFQLVAMILLFASVGYLISNLIFNLQTAGLSISYEFLEEPAGYDINQRLIEYNSQSTHWRASVVGVLNTLLVAVVGCFFATIFGVLAGVLRLSNNWIIAKIMAAYVEIFRNVPVLIWILIINAIFLVSLPQPKAFKARGGNPPEAEMFLDAFAFTGRGIYMPKPVLQTGGMLVLGIFLLSLFVMFAYRRYARSLLYSQGRDLPTFWPSLGILFVPAIVIYFVIAATGELPIVLEYPALKGFNFKGGLWARGSFVALTFALAIYTGAFIAENVRAGILAISKGQTEAAASLGIRPNRIMSLVVLPQALRVIIPPMISNYLNLTKNSSLAIAVGYMDITGTLGGITLNQTGRAIEAILLLMAFYLFISLSISAIMNVYNKSVAIKER